MSARVNWNILAGGLVVVVPLLVILNSGFGKDPHALPSVMEGKEAPAFSLVDLEGNAVDLPSLRGRPVVLNFWSTWCGPCKLISKVVEKAAPEYKGNLKIVKIETDPNPVLVEKYEVYGLPTLMVFKDGQPVKGSKREGAINLAKLKDYLQSHGISPA